MRVLVEQTLPMFGLDPGSRSSMSIERESMMASANEQGAQDTEQQFREALLRSHRTHGFIGEMESAAAQFCREMRRLGHPPERMLRDAKRVIQETIDGHDVPMAERAILSCIQHYYRAD
jgi:hypothetical protein